MELNFWLSELELARRLLDGVAQSLKKYEQENEEKMAKHKKPKRPKPKKPKPRKPRY